MFAAAFVDELVKCAKGGELTFGDKVRNLGTNRSDKVKHHLSAMRMFGRSLVETSAGSLGGAAIGHGIGRALSRHPNAGTVGGAVGASLGALAGSFHGRHRSAVNQAREIYGKHAPRLSAMRAIGRASVYGLATSPVPAVSAVANLVGAKHSYENQLREHELKRRR